MMNVKPAIALALVGSILGCGASAIHDRPLRFMPHAEALYRYGSPGDPLYTISLEVLEGVTRPSNGAEDRSGLGFAYSDKPEGPISCTDPAYPCTVQRRSWDDDYAYLAAAVMDRSTSKSLFPSQIVGGYQGTVFFDGATLVTRQVEPSGTPTHPTRRAATPHAPFVIDSVPVPRRADTFLGVDLTADSRTDPGIRGELALADADVRCYARLRAQQRGLYGVVDALPAMPIRPAGCDATWSIASRSNNVPRLRGRLFDFGCDGYVAAVGGVFAGDELYRATQSGPVIIDRTEDLYGHSGCWIWTREPFAPFSRNPLHRVSQNRTARRHIRIVIARVGEIPYPTFPPVPPPGDCTLRPVSGRAFDFEQRWGDVGNTQSDHIDATLQSRWHPWGSWAGPLPVVDGTTREQIEQINAPPVSEMRTLTLVPLYTTRLPTYRVDIREGQSLGWLIGGSVPQPYSRRCARFTNVRCRAASSGPIISLGPRCWIDSGQAEDETPTLAASGVTLSLYGEFDAQGELVQHRVRYRREPGGTDFMLRPTFEPPR